MLAFTQASARLIVDHGSGPGVPRAHPVGDRDAPSPLSADDSSTDTPAAAHPRSTRRRPEPATQRQALWRREADRHAAARCLPYWRGRADRSGQFPSRRICGATIRWRRFRRGRARPPGRNARIDADVAAGSYYRAQVNPPSPPRSTVPDRTLRPDEQYQPAPGQSRGSTRRFRPAPAREVTADPTPQRRQGPKPAKYNGVSSVVEPAEGKVSHGAVAWRPSSRTPLAALKVPPVLAPTCPVGTHCDLPLIRHRRAPLGSQLIGRSA